MAEDCDVFLLLDVAPELELLIHIVNLEMAKRSNPFRKVDYAPAI